MGACDGGRCGDVRPTQVGLHTAYKVSDPLHVAGPLSMLCLLNVVLESALKPWVSGKPEGKAAVSRHGRKPAAWLNCVLPLVLVGQAIAGPGSL